MGFFFFPNFFAILVSREGSYFFLATVSYFTAGMCIVWKIFVNHDYVGTIIKLTQ